MKKFDFGVLILIGIAIYLYAFPKVEVQKVTEYIKGDTSEVVQLRDSLDHIKYSFDSYKDSLFQIKPRTVYLPGKVKRVVVLDTVFVPYNWAYFNLGTDTLGTSGKVSHSQDLFVFDSIKYRYPEIIKTVTDTVKQLTTITESTAWYQDHWFYSTIALLYLIIQGLF